MSILLYARGLLELFDGKFFLWDPYNTSPKLTYTAAMDVAGILYDWLGLEGKDLRL